MSRATHDTPTPHPTKHTPPSHAAASAPPFPFIGPDDVPALLTPVAAADALEQALRDGLDPEEGQPRVHAPVGDGELLLMPAAGGGYAGVKLAGVAPGNPERGLPRITGGYLLFDGPTLTPLAYVDGPALTSLRTPAVSALALRHLAPPGARHLVVFGAGPQAYHHVEAALGVAELSEVTVVARRPDAAGALVAHAESLGLDARTGTASDVARADLVACCTTAREPLFDGSLVPAHAAVVAVGSHEPEARELDTELMRRSAVFVEARSAALREAGDLLVPIAEGAFGPEHIAGTLAELVSGEITPTRGYPQVFKSVGMAWEDLAVAAALHRAVRTGAT
ncbi:ornithine cyclodeaminase family protein [Streptomyces sp. NPDC001941]|uniref:ornithine cyclodeaminase family protein n=1 Tax=Streptomyces sp. NPDC001941 TaxID=3154659 RepID=UPI003332A8C4